MNSWLSSTNANIIIFILYVFLVAVTAHAFISANNNIIPIGLITIFISENLFTNITLSILIVYIISYITAILLSLYIIIISNKGYISDKMKRYCQFNSRRELLGLIVIIRALILFILNVLLIIISYFFIDLNFNGIMIVK